MANGDVTIRLDTPATEGGPEMRAIMPDYKASDKDIIAAINQGSRFMELSQQANIAAQNADAAKLNVQGNLGAALINAYNQQMQTIEITSGDETLYKGSMTPELANNLEKAVKDIGAQLNTLKTACENRTFTSTDCEGLQKSVPANVIKQALGGPRQ